MKHHTMILLMLPLLLILNGCGNKVPDDDDTQPSDSDNPSTDNDTFTDVNPDAGPDSGDTGNTDDTDTSLSLEEDYYPMAEGFMWVYQENEGSTTRELTYTISGKDSMTLSHLNDGPHDVFELDATQSDTAEWTRQYIENKPDRAMRLMQEVFDFSGTFTKQRDYVPGFLRFDRKLMVAAGGTFTEQVTRYQDTNPADGILTVAPLIIEYNYTVTPGAMEVTVPAGTFTGCIEVKRFSTKDEEGTVMNETKTYTFAKGVGKVREVTENSSKGSKTEVLLRCTAPMCPPSK